jgi:imidazolonepropionase-like amidohydrolase
MKTTLPLFLSLALAVILPLLFPACGKARVKAIVGGAIINTGSTITTLEDSAILIDGDRIVEVGKRGEVDIPQGAEIIHTEGKWIIPGLIDGHVHFFQSGGLYTRPDIIDLRSQRSYEEEVPWIKDHIEDTFARYLMSGVTAVVDVGGPLWTFGVREKARDMVMAPRIAVTGPLISTYRPEELAREDPPIIKADSPEEGRALVQRLVKWKPDLIKIWFILSPGENPNRYSPLIRAVVEDSHKHGIRVVAHATELEAARTAVEAGVDVLAHSIRNRVVDSSFVQLLQRKGTIYLPTLMVSMRYEEVLSQQIELTAPERNLANPQVLSSLYDLQRLPESAIPPDIAQRIRNQKPVSPNPIAMENLKILQEAGVTIALGTDAGNIGTPHGPAIFREFELMEQAGLTAGEILTSATESGAKPMGMVTELGAVRPGYLADLVILNSNPLSDIQNTSDIHRVVKGGVLLPRNG